MKLDFILQNALGASMATSAIFDGQSSALHKNANARLRDES